MTDESNDIETREGSAVAQDGAASPAPAMNPPALAVPSRTVVADVDYQARRPRPVLGPALTVAGIALWAFVVFGTYTTSWLPGGNGPLSGILAFLLATVVTLRAWVVCVRQGFPLPAAGAHDSASRYASVAILALGLWLLAVGAAVFVGRTSPANLDVLIACALLLVAAVSVAAGRRITGRAVAPQPATRRFVVLAGWLVAGLTTLGACVELIAER